MNGAQFYESEIMNEEKFAQKQTKCPVDICQSEHEVMGRVALWRSEPEREGRQKINK